MAAQSAYPGSFYTFVESELEKLKVSLVRYHDSELHMRHSECTGPPPCQRPLFGRQAKDSKHHTSMAAAFSMQEVSEVPDAFSLIPGLPAKSCTTLVAEQDEDIVEPEFEYEDDMTSNGSDCSPACANWGRYSHTLLRDFQHVSSEDRTYMTLLSPWKVHTQVSGGTGRGTGRLSFFLQQEALLQDSEDLHDDAAEARWFQISPSGSIKQALMTASVALTALDVACIPLTLFDLGEEIAYMFNLIAVTTFSFWLIDFCFNWVTGVEIDADIDWRPSVIARSYIKSWFVLDVGLLLLDVLLFILEASLGSIGNGVQLLFVLQMFRMIRFMRLARLSKMNSTLSAMTRGISSVELSLALSVCWSLLLVLVLNHYIACGFLGLGRNLTHLHGSESSRTWLERLELEDTPFILQYTTSLHWSLCQFAPSTNNVRPVNSVERVYGAIVVLSAMAVFSSVLGQMSASIVALRSVSKIKSKEVLILQQFFAERNLPRRLLAQVKQSVVKRSRSKAILEEAQIKILEDAPRNLRMLVHRAMFEPFLCSFAWLPALGLQQDNHRVSLDVCHEAIVEKVAAPSSCLFSVNRTSTGPLLITSGHVWYFTGSRDKTTGTSGERIESRRWFCEVALWASDWKHRGTAESEDRSHYLTIGAATFAELAQIHGGPLFKHLQSCGILLLSYAEEDESITDLSIDGEVKKRVLSLASVMTESSFAVRTLKESVRLNSN